MYKTILVNKDNKIKDNYLKKINLVETVDFENNKVLVEKETLDNFLELKKYLANRNIEISIDSGYRSIDDQINIKEHFLEVYGKDYCEQVVAEPYTSEHHTGLAIDVIIKVDNQYPKNNLELEKQTEYYEGIHKYLKDYGFILRYSKGKEEITGYDYEPWHIRYVGKIPAAIMYENNWTLEEYLEEFNGLVAINKPKGVTSFDVVNEISHIFGIKKVGHTGTLDPLAEGVLIIAIGKATKIVELVTSSYKEYNAEAKLGIKTDTDDITGNIINTSTNIDTSNIEKVLNSFKKTYLQTVPIYSAVKVNGKKLYEYARNKENVTLPKKEVTIKEIELLSKTNDTFKFKTLVSKGTYIRSLINDIGLSLNSFATMTKLTRTKQANINIKDTYTIEDIKSNNYKLYSIDEILGYRVVKVDEELEFKIRNGQKLPNTFNVEDKIVFKNKNNKILGIYQNIEGSLKVWKNFQ